MNTTRSVPWKRIFFIFMLVGFFAGSTVGLARGNAGERLLIPVAGSGSMGLSTATLTAGQIRNGQHNLLVVYVDRLRAPEPRLESVWLALYVPAAPHVTLLPLYPLGAPEPAPSDLLLNAAFGLEDEGRPGQAFLAALQARDLWWDHYLVIDEVGLVELLDAAGSLSLGAERSGGVRTVADLPLTWESPQAALLSQATVLGALCQKTAEGGAPLDAGQVYEALETHIATDWSQDGLVKDWTALTQGGRGLLCKFPTLGASPD